MRINISFVVLVFISCVSDPPAAFSTIKVKSWKLFTNEVAGYSLSYPEELDINQHHDRKDVLFRYDGYPIIAVNFIDSTEGRKRGLWVQHPPVDDITLGSNSGKKYEYTHYDAIFGMPVQSYVISHQGKLLGLEFRKSGDLGPILKRILDSFSVIPES